MIPTGTTRTAVLARRPRIYLVLGHGDSRLGGVYTTSPAPTYPPGRAWQYVGNDTNTSSYTTLTPSTITQTMIPFENPVPNQGDTVCVPMHYAIAKLLDSASPYYCGADAIFVYIGGGQNGANVADGGHSLGPLPDLITGKNVTKANAAYVAARAKWPGAAIVPLIVTVDGTNDSTTTAATMLTAKMAQLDGANSLRTINGFSSAPEVVVSVLGDRAEVNKAQFKAAMKTAGAIWCQLTGVATPTSLHEGETGLGDAPSAGIITAGETMYARSMAIALGKYNPAAATISTSTTLHVDEGSSTNITFQGNKKVYGTVRTGYTSVIAMSGDTASDIQDIQPAGGTWPAYTGTSADTIPIVIDWIDEDGKTGTFSANIVIDQVVVTPYLVYDDFNRADVGQSDGGCGTTSGNGGYGGGLTWTGYGGIASNKADLYGGSTGQPTSLVDIGATYVAVTATITVGASKGPILIAASDGSGRRVAFYSNAGTAQLIQFNGGPAFLDTDTALAAGSYLATLKVIEGTPDDTAEVWINGSLFMSGTMNWKANTSTDTKVGMALDFATSGLTIDDFYALPS